MSRLRTVTLSIVSSAFLVGSAWALPARSTDNSQPSSAAQDQNAPETQSVVGKITAVSSTSFSLTPAQDGDRNPGQNFTAPQNNPLTFIITPDTIVDGKLKVGASANVVYRPDDKGNNVAVNVTVTP